MKSDDEKDGREIKKRVAEGSSSGPYSFRIQGWFGGLMGLGTVSDPPSYHIFQSSTPLDTRVHRHTACGSPV